MAVAPQNQQGPSPVEPPLLPGGVQPKASSLWHLGGRAAPWLSPLAVIVAVLVIWETCTVVFDIPRWLLPSPTGIVRELLASWAMFLSHTWITMQETLLGFALSLASGVLLSVLIAYSRTFERSLYPFVIASQTIPIIAIAPLLLIWLGYGVGPKVIVVALIAFFPIVVNTVDGLKSADNDMINMMRTLGANKWQIFTKVQVPTSLPFLFSGIRVAVAVSVIGAVIGEWVGSSQGLGYLMIRSKAQFLTERVFAAIFILSLMGIGLFLMVGLVERYVIPWHRRERRMMALEKE